MSRNGVLCFLFFKRRPIKFGSLFYGKSKQDVRAKELWRQCESSCAVEKSVGKVKCQTRWGRSRQWLIVAGLRQPEVGGAVSRSMWLKVLLRKQIRNNGSKPPERCSGCLSCQIGREKRLAQLLLWKYTLTPPGNLLTAGSMAIKFTL